MENIYTVEESLVYSTLYVQTVPQIFINTSSSAVSDTHILKLITYEH